MTSNQGGRLQAMTPLHSSVADSVLKSP